MNFCRDCKWRRGSFLPVYMFALDRCAHPAHADPVTGDGVRACKDMRSPAQPCYNGKLFEPKQSQAVTA